MVSTPDAARRGAGQVDLGGDPVGHGHLDVEPAGGVVRHATATRPCGVSSEVSAHVIPPPGRGATRTVR